MIHIEVAVDHVEANIGSSGHTGHIGGSTCLVGVAEGFHIQTVGVGVEVDDINITRTGSCGQVIGVDFKGASGSRSTCVELGIAHATTGVENHISAQSHCRCSVSSVVVNDVAARFHHHSGIGSDLVGVAVTHRDVTGGVKVSLAVSGRHAFADLQVVCDIDAYRTRCVHTGHGVAVFESAQLSDGDVCACGVGDFDVHITRGAADRCQVGGAHFHIIVTGGGVVANTVDRIQNHVGSYK